MIYLFRLPPDLQQYFGKDCQALEATIGGLASNKKLRIWTTKKKLETLSLTKSDLSCIMSFLSDDAMGDAMGRLLEWFQNKASFFSDESMASVCRQNFEPR
jgi:hypothetical protein